MEEQKDIENILHKNQLDTGIMSEDDLKFIHGGGYSVSETEGDGQDSVTFKF